MKKNQHKILIILFLLLLILLSFNFYYFFIRRDVGLYYYVHKILYNSTDKILELDIYKDFREEYFYLNKNYSKPKIVFVGDSITKRFNIQEFTGNCQIINRGIFFDTTLGLLDRLDANINNLNVDTLFLMIGYNDLLYRTNDDIISNLDLIISKLNANRIYIQSLLPVSSERSDLNDRIIDINKHLKIISSKNNIMFIDLHTHFKTNSNCIRPELTSDGIHPNYLGYKLWFSLVEHLL